MLRRFLVIVACATLVSAASARQTAYWSAAPGPYGGSVTRDMAVTSDGTVFAATTVGVFRSVDGGNSWEGANDGLLTRDVRSVLVREDGSLWVATYGTGLYRLAPGSTTWQAAGLASTLATVIEESPTGTLLAGTNAGIRISTDNGSTWTSHTLEGTLLPVQAIAANTTHLFAGTTQGVYRSTDDGETWSFAAFGFEEFDIRSLATNAAGHVFAGVNPDAGGCVLYRSRGNGGTWTCIQPISDPVMVPAIRVDEDDRLIAGAYRTVLTSTDEGDHWTSRSAGSTSIESIVVLEDAILAGTNGMGILRSTDDGSTWQDASQGIRSGIRSLLTAESGSVYVGTDGGVFVSEDRGITWERLGSPNPLVQPITALALDDQERVVAGTPAGVWRWDSENGWQDIGPFDYPGIRDIVATPDGQLYAGYHSGVYVHDRGTWTPVPIYGPEQSTRDVSSLVLTSQGTLLAGAAWDSWRRESGSDTWSIMSAGEVPWFEVESFAVDGTRVLAGTRYLGIIESLDDGISWHGLGTGLFGSEDVRAIGIDKSGHIHIGTYGSGIYQLNPWTNQWMAMNTGLEGNHRVLSLAFGADGSAWAGTLGGGLYRHVLPATATELGSEAPAEIGIAAIYPNPARGETRVTIRTQIPGPVSVRMFDLLGREVRQVTARSPGEAFEVSLDLSTLAAGAYLIRVESNVGTCVGSGKILTVVR